MLGTDYADFGFLHCVDTEDDLAEIRKNGILDYVRELKAQGVVMKPFHGGQLLSEKTSPLGKALTKT